ncbi:MAG: AtpZ/AtpI family protein [Acidobacteriaceae bacterium]
MPSDKKNPLVTIVRYSEIGFILPAAVLLGYLLGTGLDHWLHTTWIVVAGVIFGVISGFVSMIRMAMRTEDEKE